MTNDAGISEVLRRIEARLEQIEVAIRDHPAASISPGHRYSRREAARLLGVSIWMIDRARKKGLLTEAERLGQRDVRITGDSLLAFIQRRQAGAVRVQEF